MAEGDEHKDNGSGTEHLAETEEKQSVNVEVYKTIFETWRFQVDSYWQRSSYFAAFETATIAGVWGVLEANRLWTGLTFSVLGLALTLIWFLNNAATHKYVLHWWNALKTVEEKLSLKNYGTDFVTQHEGSGGMVPYRILIQSVPGIFTLAWAALFAWGLYKLCQRIHA
jgi:hypothetical protein